IIPKPDLVERALNLSNGDIKIGFLDIPGINAKVSINSYDLNYHMIVIGTTGAGKTSFIKNLIMAMVNSRSRSKVFIFDATGDYYNIFLPPEVYNNEHEELLGSRIFNLEVNILFPISSKWAKKYLKNNKRDVYSIASVYYLLYIKPIIDYLQNKGLKLYSTINKNSIIISNSEWNGKANILPFYFRFKDVKRILHKLNPYFTEQASHFLRILINKNWSEFKKIDDLINFVLDEDKFENIRIHRSTRENIVRGLYLLKETGLFNIGVDRYPFSSLLENNNIQINIIDLYNSEIDDFAQKILSYYFLDKIFNYREKEMKSGGVKDRIVIVIDEAHRFFPSSKGSEEDNTYVRRVANKISTLMRLGRRRKVGFIFSTHNPNDLNDIVIQLSNTKVVFRTKPEIAESLGLSKVEARNLSWERNGVAYLISPWLREGKIKIRIPLPPAIGHYDLSRT
ncbi:MAG: ATP-binding protein, partial [Sulfolobales archaeon]